MGFQRYCDNPDCREFISGRYFNITVNEKESSSLDGKEITSVEGDYCQTCLVQGKYIRPVLATLEASKIKTEDKIQKANLRS